MDVNITQENGIATVAVAGSLDTNTSPELEAKVAEVLKQSSTIVFDFSALGYISSSGLRVVLGAHRSASAAGGSVSVTGCNDAVREVFEITGFSTIISIA